MSLLPFYDIPRLSKSLTNSLLVSSYSFFILSYLFLYSLSIILVGVTTGSGEEISLLWFADFLRSKNYWYFDWVGFRILLWFKSDLELFKKLLLEKFLEFTKDVLPVSFLAGRATFKSVMDISPPASLLWRREPLLPSIWFMSFMTSATL